MNAPIDLDRKVYFKLETTVRQHVLARIQKFLVDGVTGNVTLNIKDGEILGCHIEEILSSKGPPPVRRRTA